METDRNHADNIAVYLADNQYGKTPTTRKILQ